MTSTDTSSSAYISRTQAKNLLASIANRTRPGPGVQTLVSLGQIVSVLDLPKPPAPTELMFASAGSAGSYELCWKNNTTELIDTLIELNPGTGWTTYAHGPLLDPSAATITGISGATQVRVSTIGTGNVTSDPSIPVLIIVSLNNSIPVPTGISTRNNPLEYGSFIITWTNNAPNMIDTIIEINGLAFDNGDPFTNVNVSTWPIYPHAPLGNANTITVSGYNVIEPRIYSVTTAGVSNVVDLYGNGT